MFKEDEIRNRAYSIYELSKKFLVTTGEDECIAEAFRFAKLIIYGPKRFLFEYGKENLYLDYSKVFDGYRSFQYDLAGPIGLTNEEEHLIFVHNEEVKKLLHFI